MSETEVIRESIEQMEDADLIARWKSRQFTEEAQRIAVGELHKRGINPDNPVAAEEVVEAEIQPRPYRPRFLPLLFAIFAVPAGSKLGAELGELHGILGAAFGGAIASFAGWYIGGIIAKLARTQSLVIRWAVYVVTTGGWFIICGAILVASSWKLAE